MTIQKYADGIGFMEGGDEVAFYSYIMKHIRVKHKTISIDDLLYISKVVRDNYTTKFNK